MPRSRYRIYEAEYPYFITSSVVEGYPIFSFPEAAEILLEALTFLQEKRSTTLFAYVIMENHIHMIVQSDELKNHMKAFKSWTARAIIDCFQHIGRTRQLRKLRYAKNPAHYDSVHQLWQEGLFPKQIFSDDMMIQKIDYIHKNPVKRGFVNCPEHWNYSSARNYLGIKGVIPVTMFGL
ncbi:transposase [Rhodohalobacter sp. SW132]|uniref:REP-associated tyrosine transposase n=1 Tax=Rhodohalobacter sp. SW132 TaxID=2293433 RepID=UPI000E245FEA|nr:transposase [Rhodohalobacter sp. SW132]REL32839.1 transposase [Rhodohalobacter sp. SW132]